MDKRVIIKIVVVLFSTSSLYNAFPRTLLYVAASNNQLELAQQLIAAGASLNVQCGQEKMTPLGVAIFHKNLAVAQYLLEGGADCDMTDATQATPLHCACIGPKINKKCIKILLEAGAHLDLTDSLGRLPSDPMLSCGNLDVALLIDEERKKRDSIDPFVAHQKFIMIIHEAYKLPELGLSRVIADYSESWHSVRLKKMQRSKNLSV